MPERWVRSRLGDALQLRRDLVQVDPSTTYRLAGVYSFGRGLFQRSPLLGSETSYSHLHALRGGTFVVSRLKAWEGAIAVVPEAFGGAVLSPEFPTYEINTKVLSPEYLSVLCSQRSFWDLLATTSRGMGGRKERVHQERILALTIDLPPLAVQRRIVDLVGTVDRYLASAKEHARAARVAQTVLLKDQMTTSADTWPEATLGELVSITIGRTPPRNEPRYWTEQLDRPFCSIADMTSHRVRPIREGVTEAAEVEGKARRFPSGALLMSFKLTIGRLGFAAVDLFPNEAIAWLQPTSPQILDAYLALWLQNMDLNEYAASAVKGKTLNGQALRSIPVRCPGIAAQKRIIELMDSMMAEVQAADSVVVATEQLRLELVAELVSQSREIPDTYDRLIETVG